MLDLSSTRVMKKAAQRCISDGELALLSPSKALRLRRTLALYGETEHVLGCIYVQQSAHGAVHLQVKRLATRFPVESTRAALSPSFYLIFMSKWEVDRFLTQLRYCGKLSFKRSSSSA